MPVAEDLDRGRALGAKGAWLAAHEALTRADRCAPLNAGDIDLLATCAYMLGRDQEYADHLERAHHLCLDAGVREGRPLLDDGGCSTSTT
jgi:hypothetical protein